MEDMGRDTTVGAGQSQYCTTDLPNGSDEASLRYEVIDSIQQLEDEIYRLGIVENKMTKQDTCRFLKSISGIRGQIYSLLINIATDKEKIEEAQLKIANSNKILEAMESSRSQAPAVKCWSKDLEEAKREVARARRRYQREWHPEEKVYLRAQYSELRNRYGKFIKEAKLALKEKCVSRVENNV